MTFAAQAQTAGREIVRIVELVVPRCVLRYGNAPCTAGARAVNHPNLIQQSEVFSGGTPAWNLSGTRALSSFIAPNSTMTGVLLVDSHNAASHIVETFVNSTDPVFASLSASAWLNLSVHLVKKPGTEQSVAIRVQGFDGVGSTDYRFALDGYTGVWSTREINAYGGAPVAPKVIDCGSWWRFGFGFNRAACNSLTVSFRTAWRPSGNLTLAADAAAVGSAGVWGAMLAVNTTQMPPYLTRGVESQWITTGLAAACYQTAHTCEALSSYLQGEQSIFFVDQQVSAPLGVDAFPALVDARLTPFRMNPHTGIGESAKLDLEFRDFPYNDRGTDPYVDARSYNPNSQGTFFGRLFARDPYVHGKKLRYYEGYYSGSGTHTFSHYLTREFIIDEVDRPDSRGRLRMRATDLLRLTNGDRSLCPVPSTATLQGNITAADSVFYMASTNAASYLTGDVHVRIDDELLQLVTRTNCSWTTVRGAGKTEAAVHSAGSVVQLCKTYSYMNVTSICMDLLVNFSSIPSSYIPVNSWDAEKTATLTDYNLYNILSEPRAVRDHLVDITAACDLSLWYDETVSKISLRHQSPWAAAAVVLSDSAHFVADTMAIKSRDDLKVSRFGVRYAPTNYADASDFSRFQMAVNSSREDPRFDGRKSEKTVETAWLSASHDNLAATIAGRGMRRYSELEPLEASFKVDATTVASVHTGDVVEMQTRLLQDVDGTMAPTRMQVVEHAPDRAGHSYRYNAVLFQGLTAATSLSIDVSTYNYNVHSAMGGPSQAVRVYLTVNSLVVVGGSGTGEAAITTSGLPSGSVVYLTLLGSAQVLGDAVLGGSGAAGTVIFATGTIITASAQQGQQGGSALYVAPGVTTYIDVSAGYLFAGGGGGGGGGVTAVSYNPAEDWGGYGGLSQGYTNSGGPSAGGTGVAASQPDGGLGGIWGATGATGANGTHQNGAPGGTAGRAVHLADASAVYFFTGGYDSDHVKGAVGL